MTVTESTEILHKIMSAVHTTSETLFTRVSSITAVISVSLMARDATVAYATGSGIAGVVAGVDVLFFAAVVFVLVFADVRLKFNTDVALVFTVDKLPVVVVVSIGVAVVPTDPELFAVAVVISAGARVVTVKLFVVAVVISTGARVVTVKLFVVVKGTVVNTCVTDVVLVVVRTTHAINPQLEPPLKHLPIGGGVQASHLPLAAVYGFPLIHWGISTNWNPRAHSPTALHGLHTEPSNQKPCLHDQLTHPTALHEAFWGSRLDSQDTHTVSLLTVHALSTFSQTEHCLQLMQVASSVAVHCFSKEPPFTQVLTAHA